VKIGVIGAGVVGRATARCWLEHCDEVCVYDVLRERSTHSLDRTLACDLIFVCLPEDVVEQFFFDRTHNGIRPHAGANFVLKSTVPIGTTRRLAEKYSLPNLVYSPEFLTARCALTDVQVPARNIIGVPSLGNDNACATLLNDLYERRFPGIQCLWMGSDESEAVKLMTNAFFATKIAFFNEMYRLVQRLGLDWNDVHYGILADGRIAHSHTQVPGPDGKFGFGGSCLPKDLNMLINQIKDSTNDADACLLGAVRLRNDLKDRKGL
jgi:nucleotide sugar dehydrogenase